MKFVRPLSKSVVLLLSIVLVVLGGVGVYQFYVAQNKKITESASLVSDLLPVVFLLPHQDDEMFMGGAMQQAVASGRQVYVVMVTDGSASSARHIINGEDSNHHPVFDTVYRRFHRPAREGYDPLDARAFTEARNKEYVSSVAALGIPPDHIWFANPGEVFGSETPLYINDTLTIATASQAIDQVFKIVGDGTYVTLAANLGALNAQHGDHLALREALREFKGIHQKQFFSEKIGDGHPQPVRPLELTQKGLALAHYFVWDPKNGRFAIGEHSVPALLHRWAKSPFEYLLDETDFLPEIKK